MRRERSPEVCQALPSGSQSSAPGATFPRALHGVEAGSAPRQHQEASVSPDRPGLRLAAVDALARLKGRTAPAILALAGLVGAPGCVHVYQPMNGFHRPILVDTQAPNFPDLNLTVVCLPGELVNRTESRHLCQRVGKLFENQGAKVTTVTSDRRFGEEALEDDGSEEEAPVEHPTDLVLELRARRLHLTSEPLSWIFCIGSATLIPAVTEATFAQDVEIRDGTGFLLIRDSMEGRLVRTFGVGSWLGNKLLDLVWRKKDQRISGKAAHRDLSADLYGQLSQLVFNAKMRWTVLREATPDGRATGEAP